MDKQNYLDSNFTMTHMLCIISILLMLINGCNAERNNTSENHPENILLEFYTKHFQIWKIPTLPSVARYEKLDSLMQIYCTSKLRNKARETFENVGVDLLTNDLIGDLNENLKVEKDTAYENGFIVSFISDVAIYADAPGNPTKKRVILHVTLVKEGENYKIDDLK